MFHTSPISPLAKCAIQGSPHTPHARRLKSTVPGEGLCATYPCPGFVAHESTVQPAPMPLRRSRRGLMGIEASSGGSPAHRCGRGARPGRLRPAVPRQETVPFLESTQGPSSKRDGVGQPRPDDYQVLLKLKGRAIFQKIPGSNYADRSVPRVPAPSDQDREESWPSSFQRCRKRFSGVVDIVV